MKLEIRSPPLLPLKKEEAEEEEEEENALEEEEEEEGEEEETTPGFYSQLALLTRRPRDTRAPYMCVSPREQTLTSF
jgi:hypothetical protein